MSDERDTKPESRFPQDVMGQAAEQILLGKHRLGRGAKPRL